MFGLAKTYRAIKGASIAVSAGLGAGREIVTVCVRGALLTTRSGFCHGAAEGAPVERDSGRNTVKSVQGRIRLAHWNRWSFIGCVILSRILWNWMRHVHTRTFACIYTCTGSNQGEGGTKLFFLFFSLQLDTKRKSQLAHVWVNCNVRMQQGL